MFSVLDLHHSRSMASNSMIAGLASYNRIDDADVEIVFEDGHSLYSQSGLLVQASGFFAALIRFNGGLGGNSTLHKVNASQLTANSDSLRRVILYFHTGRKEDLAIGKRNVVHFLHLHFILDINPDMEYLSHASQCLNRNGHWLDKYGWLDRLKWDLVQVDISCANVAQMLSMGSCGHLSVLLFVAMWYITSREKHLPVDVTHLRDAAKGAPRKTYEQYRDLLQSPDFPDIERGGRAKLLEVCNLLYGCVPDM